VKSRRSSTHSATVSAALGLLVLLSPGWISPIRAWVSQTWQLDYGAFVKCIFLLQALATVHILVAGTMWVRGKLLPTAVIGLPVLAPLAVGLVGAAIDYLAMQHDATMFPDLEHRLLTSIGAVQFDKRRVLGLLGTGLLAVAVGIFSLFHGPEGADSGASEQRSGSKAAYVASGFGLGGGLLWYAWRATWPADFEWLVIGTLMLAATASISMSLLRTNRMRGMVAFFFSHASVLFCCAEYAARRDHVLEGLPTDLPFIHYARRPEDISHVLRPSLALALVFPVLTLVVLSVPLVFGDVAPDLGKRLRPRVVIRLALSLVFTSALVCAFDLLIERNLSEAAAPLERFRRIAEFEPPPGIASAMVDGHALIVTRDAKLLLDGQRGTSAVPLLAADRRLTLDHLWDALLPVRHESRIEAKLVVGPSRPTLGPSRGGFTDTFSGELGVRTVLLALRGADVDDWLRERDRRGLVILLDDGSARCFFLENPRRQMILPLGPSASDRLRRKEAYEELSWSEGPPPRMIVFVPRNDQSIEQVIAAVDAVELLRFDPRASKASWAFILTPDRAKIEALWTNVPRLDQ
jgi:hypothetical protein